MEKLFTYGTLQDPDTQMRLLGRHLGEGKPDTLRGYRLAKLVGIHAAYSIIQPKPSATVAGIVHEVSADELERLDIYEGNAYLRVSVTLVSGTRAWVYSDHPKSNYRQHIEALEGDE